MNEEEKWSLELKIIAFRKQTEAQNILERKIQEKILLIRQEKIQLYKKIEGDIKKIFINSLPYTIPISCLNMLLMKSLMIIPFTILSGALIVHKIA